MLTKRLCCVCVCFMFYTIAFVLSGEECPCRIDSIAKIANCNRCYLKAVPYCVPRSVKELLFSENVIEGRIRPRQFEKFNELVYLNLSLNGITYLSDDAFTGLTSLETLDLSFNRITVLNTAAYSKISKLRKLTLSYNLIREIKTNVFSRLLNLKWLDLDFIPIKYLNAGSFAGLSSLKYLQLNIQLLQSFPMDVFKPLSKLEELTIHMYESKYIHIDQRLKWLTSLKILIIDSYVSQDLGAGFTFLRNLEQLHLSYGYLPAISKETFNNLKNSPLRTISLIANNISVIYPSTFTSLKYLERLSITKNFKICEEGLHNITVGLKSTNIQYLDLLEICDKPCILSYELILELQVTHLKVLNLSHSDIMFLEAKFLKVLPHSLMDLNLQGNYLKEIDLYELYCFENLQFLNIRHNKAIYEESFDSPMNDAYHNFKKQRISSDSITKISATKIQGTNTAFTLPQKMLSDSEVSPVTRFDVIEGRKPSKYSCNFESIPQCSRLPYRLNTIDLSSSSLLESVLNILCGTNNSLEILIASNLVIKEQEREIYFEKFWERMKDLRMLKQLDLSGNSIKEIPTGSFSEQTHLKILSLSRNLLEDVKFDSQNLFRLETLDLSHNRITYIPSLFFQQIETIAKHSNITVYLQGNMLSCQCDQLEFVTWLLHTRVIFRKDTLTCKYRNGTNLALSRISDIHNQLEAECYFLLVLLGSIMGFITLSLILSVVAVIYHKQWKFNYLSLIGRRNINPYHPIEDRNILLEYDIYISYDRDHVVSTSETLHELVTQRIYPSLKQRGLKLIIREELDIGRKLFDVISHALRRTRKVVILLSNKYCKDHWNLFEFNMSVMEGIYTKREVVVPVMLETPNPEDFREEVIAFLRSGPIARFTFDRNVKDLINYLFESAR